MSPLFRRNGARIFASRILRLLGNITISLILRTVIGVILFLMFVGTIVDEYDLHKKKRQSQLGKENGENKSKEKDGKIASYFYFLFIGPMVSYLK